MIAVVETFLLRLWVPALADEPSAPAFHGLLVHVETGWERAFGSSDELVALVRGWSRSGAEGISGMGSGTPLIERRDRP